MFEGISNLNLGVSASLLIVLLAALRTFLRRAHSRASNHEPSDAGNDIRAVHRNTKINNIGLSTERIKWFRNECAQTFINREVRQTFDRDFFSSYDFPFLASPFVIVLAMLRGLFHISRLTLLATFLAVRDVVLILATGTNADHRRPPRRSAQNPKPPGLAEYLLELLASPDWTEAAAGDFFEKYERKFRRVQTKHGNFAAKLDYWWQVVRSAPGLLRIRFRHLAALAGLAKLFDILQKYWTAK